jgi:hypothetical protein
LHKAHQSGRKKNQNGSFGNYKRNDLERNSRETRQLPANPHNRYFKIIHICVQKSKLGELEVQHLQNIMFKRKYGVNLITVKLVNY